MFNRLISKILVTQWEKLGIVYAVSHVNNFFNVVNMENREKHIA